MWRRPSPPPAPHGLSGMLMAPGAIPSPLQAGNLSKEYFRPKTAPLTELRWTAEASAGLIAGIEAEGVGNWRAISAGHLGGAWTDIQLKIKTSKLLGVQKLEGYEGWKGGAAAIAAVRPPVLCREEPCCVSVCVIERVRVCPRAQEYEKNKALGLASGRWNGVVLTPEPVAAEPPK